MLKMQEQPTKQQRKEPTGPLTQKKKQSLGRTILMFPLTRLLVAATMFVIVFVTIFLFAAFLSGFVTGFIEGGNFLSGVPGDVIQDVYQPLIDNVEGEFALALAGIITLVLMGKVIERRSLAEVGLGGRGLLRHTSLGFSIATVMTLMLLLGSALGVIATPDELADSLYWQQLGVFGYLAAAFVFTCFIAVSEETIFRGLIFRILEEGLGSWLALPISALWFGMVHMTNYSSGATLITVTPQIAMGLSLAAAYLLTRKLWLAIGFHWGWDFMLSPTTGGDIFKDSWGAATSLDPSDMVVIGISLIVAVVLLALAVRRGQIRTPRWMQRKPTHNKPYIDENSAPLTEEKEKRAKKGGEKMRDEVQATGMSGSSSVPLEQPTRGSAKLWITLGIVFAIIALVFAPPLFGGLGILFGYLARRRGSETGGVATMYISGTAMVVGMIFGFLVALLA